MRRGCIEVSFVLIGSTGLEWGISGFRLLGFRALGLWDLGLRVLGV